PDAPDTPAVLDVLDVGCGTGISARPFLNAGCRVLGVEPDARMAERARHGGVEVEVATFESWDPVGRTFDAVVSGQSWHWVDPDAGAAKAARVLRPGGRLAAFWNVFQPPSELGASFAAVYRRVLPDLPYSGNTLPGLEAYEQMAGKAAGGMRGSGAFGEPELWHLPWERVYTREEWLDQVPTFGGHHLLPPAQLAELLAGIGEVVDAAGGSFTMNYTTLAITARLA
ncbi:class I SAM-dependent methyltransferase, partial [Nonomuraea sp. NN258]|uniref:class I SAM-dependent methyltransferase n=1 Tax=Nonomuraea antri TaxID=2730852 RepID=UPI001569F15C